MEPMKILTPEGELTDADYWRTFDVVMQRGENRHTVTVWARSIGEARVRAEEIWAGRAVEFTDYLTREVL